MLNRFRVYCGPTITETTAKRLTDAGFRVYLVGTEHIYVETFCNASSLLRALPTWRPGDIILLGSY